MYIPHHPAVLRAIERVVKAARRGGIQVSVCGEMGSDVRLLPFLLGIGIRHISVNAEAIPRVRIRISEIDTRKACKLAKELVALGRISDVEECLLQGG